MKIDVVFPKKYSKDKIINKTREYFSGNYNKLKAYNVFEGENKEYYVYIGDRNIQIELIVDNSESISNIEEYLRYLFCNDCLGISFDSFKGILFNLNCYYLNNVKY